MTSPAPRPWRIQSLEIVQRADRDVLAVLTQAAKDIDRMIREIERRQTIGVSAAVRREQLLLIKRNIKLEQAKIWAKLKNIIRQRRLEASARSIHLAAEFDQHLLASVLGASLASDIVRQISAAETKGAESAIDRMLARLTGRSYVPLSQRVYLSEVRLNAQLDRLVNSALARGLSARQFAKEAASFIDPLTPGGIRYAAFRLARTEINNAAHAIAISNAQGKPWIDGMEWHLSGSHPRPDICDEYAHGGKDGDGIYAPDQVPAKPHPHCFCYVVPVVESMASFKARLRGGAFDDYLAKYMDLAA